MSALDNSAWSFTVKADERASPDRRYSATLQATENSAVIVRKTAYGESQQEAIETLIDATVAADRAADTFLVVAMGALELQRIIVSAVQQLQFMDRIANVRKGFGR